MEQARFPNPYIFSTVRNALGWVELLPRQISPDKIIRSGSFFDVTKLLFLNVGKRPGTNNFVRTDLSRKHLPTELIGFELFLTILKM
jgi:hypothetical protein